MDLPCLRPIEAFPVTVKGETMIALRDPQGLAAGTLCVSPAAYLILQLLDGEHAVADIQSEISRATRENVPTEALEGFLRQLDEQLFLEGPAFEAHRGRIESEFRALPVRPPSHAGGAYPAEAEPLRRQLDAFFTAPGGPGLPPFIEPHGAGGGSDGAIAGLVSPHIDYTRGGHCYAWAYRRLSRAPRPDRFLVFGTCHASMKRLFALTRKRYATPFGEARTDAAFVDALAARTGGRYFEDEFAHRGEHSIELQVVFLQHLFGPDVEIVPVLCGGLEWFLSKGRFPVETLEVQEFVGTLRELLADGRRTCVIAGADLAHVGPRFGDKAACSDAFLGLVRRHDLESLARVEGGDAEGFFKSIAEIGDKHRICGLAPIYFTLLALGDAKGKLLKYDQAPDPDRSQCVSFASLAFAGT